MPFLYVLGYSIRWRAQILTSQNIGDFLKWSIEEYKMSTNAPTHRYEICETMHYNLYSFIQCILRT